MNSMLRPPNVFCLGGYKGKMAWGVVALLSLSLGLLSAPQAFAANAITSLSDIETAPAAQTLAQTAANQPQEALSFAAVTTAKKPTASSSGKAGSPGANVSRYEMLSAMATVMKSVDSQIAELSKDKANTEDVKALQKSQSVLKNELLALSRQIVGVQTTDNEQNARLNLLEKVQIHGDMTVGALQDLAGRGSSTDNAMSALGRLRLTVDVPVVEADEERHLGPGTISSRLIAAFGRYAPVNQDGTNYPFNLYSRVTADISAFNEGFGTGSVGTNGGTGKLNGQNGNTAMTRPNLYVESAFYKQKFKSGIPLLTDLPGVDLVPDDDNWRTTGDLYAGLVRWWDIFDASPYRGDEMKQFQNNAFINTPGIAVNVAQPMLAYQLHQGLGSALSADVSMGAGSVDVGSLGNGLNLTYEGKLNYLPTFLPQKYQKPGSVYVGAYHILELGGTRSFTATSNTVNSRNGTTLDLANVQGPNTSAVYAGWNQEWARGIGTNVGVLLNGRGSSILSYTTFQPGPANVVAAARQSFAASVSVPMTAFGNGTFRPKDGMGFGYAYVDIQDGASPIAGNNRLEHVMEAYYRYQVNDSFSVVPSVQVIANPLGLESNGLITVLGCRLNYIF